MKQVGKNFWGVLCAALSSATFGIGPFMTIGLLSAALRPFEVLSYRWGLGAIFLILLTILSGHSLKIRPKDLRTVVWLSLLRATSSFCMVIAYIHIASGTASTIHFMYPLAVAATMTLFFEEKSSLLMWLAIALSIIGAGLLTCSDVGIGNGNTWLGIFAAFASVVAYALYMIGIKKSRAAQLNSTTLTCYVMIFGGLFFVVGAFATGGIRLLTTPQTWSYALGLAIVSAAISNITLVWAIKQIGPTRTSFFGALEPLTAVLIGIWLLNEPFTARNIWGIGLILGAVSLALTQSKQSK